MGASSGCTCTLAPNFFFSGAAARMWSKCPCVSRISVSVFPVAAMAASSALRSSPGSITSMSRRTSS